MNGNICLILAGFILVGCQSHGQQSDNATNPGFEAAMQKVNGYISQGENDLAIKLLDSLAQKNPKNFRVWNALGFAYNAKQDYPKVIAAYTKALKIDPERGQTQLNLGIAQINNDEIDNGIESLLKAKSTNLVNTTNLPAFPAWQKIKDDDRVAALFPTREEFADPFVEETKVIHEWVGEAQGDQFGWIARNIGDVDGDGVDDMVTSAPTSDEGGNNAGKIYVFSGKSGELIWAVTGTAAGGQLGMGIEFGGDINADGTPDVVAGAPFSNTAFAYSGIDGSVIHEFKGDATGAFGLHLSGVGDVNGDGFGDILIGEPYQVFNAPVGGNTIDHPGKAHVFSGKDGQSLILWEGEEQDDAFGTAVAGRVVDGQIYLLVGAPNAGPGNGGRTYAYKSLNSEPDFVWEADAEGSRFGGMFMSVVGDVNADGFQDLYSTDWANGGGGNGRGRAYVYSGKDGQELYNWSGETDGEGFGIGVADCGDVNGDGYDDVVIGSWQFSEAAPGAGKIRLHSGKDGSLIRAWTCKTMGETFGFDTTGMGDVDGDGTIDLLITSAWSAVNGFRSGRVFVLRGL